jgi:hypothetical protein
MPCASLCLTVPMFAKAVIDYQLIGIFLLAEIPFCENTRTIVLPILRTALVQS